MKENEREKIKKRGVELNMVEEGKGKVEGKI